MTDPIAARQELTDHPHYRYRGCAPDPDNPRMAAGDPDVSVDAWAPYTGDGAEPQRDRIAREKAAVRVCGYCPVQALCRTYASTEVVEAGSGGAPDVVRLAEPEGVWGGQIALERHRALIARRAGTAVVSEQALAEAQSPQKLAVLRALAVELYETRVAHRAGMDVRRTNWHRSALCSLLGLNKETASRDDLLVAAVRHGLLPGTHRIVWDGLWPIAAAPNTDGSRQRRIAPGFPLDLLTPRPRQRRTPTPSVQVPAGRGPATRPGDRRLPHFTPAPAAPALPLPATVLEPAA
ncbi:hypothetical protein [Streptomyces sp. sk2.1]|uniref:hypothetical protein n=1 Tax=Streptomyces sp. sk2.1 TaxID=2478959 RepID=UPI0011E862F9|nr:hypothetical protein [Streptomyces sp. sk2.1]TXS68909.1 hypothetical protein EAO76_26445 [Streptomyces sp. sk2.1]